MSQTVVQVPFFDLKRQYKEIKTEVLEQVEAVFESMMVTNGPFVEQFEKEFAAYCNVEHCAAVNTGTSALHLAMQTLDVGPGDEVIVPANTFIATPWGATYVGGIPVFVDCKADTWEIDIEAVEKAITPKTKAVIGVHLYGQPFEAVKLKALCEKHNIFLVEDAAQGHGGFIGDQKVGSIGHMACFSFYPGKNLGTYGEGGAVVSNNKDYIDRVKRLRNLGSAVRYYHEELGYNMRMGAVQGAVLSVKLKRLDTWNARRQEIANRYLSEIKNDAVQYQHQPENFKSVFHLFVIKTADRKGFMDYMETNQVGAAMHYPVPCHLQECYANLGYKVGDFPESESLAASCVSLPLFPEMTKEEVNRTIEVVNAYQA